MAWIDADFPLDLASFASLEAQVAAIADDIAYDNHDIDDGLRAGILTIDQLREQPFVAANLVRVEAALPGVPEQRQLRELVRSQIGLMVNDVIAATLAATEVAGVTTLVDVRAAGRALAGFSPKVAEAERALKAFLYRTLYHHQSQIDAADAARDVVSRLFAAYHNRPEAMGGNWRAGLPGDETGRARHIADYIAGMTDRFALDRCADLFGAAAVPEVLRRG